MKMVIVPVIVVVGVLMFTIGQTELTTVETAKNDAAAVLAMEMFAHNEKVIPLAYDHRDYHCLHVKPPEVLIRNTSNGKVTLTVAGIIGRSDGREVARFVIYEDQISALMPAANKKLNEYLSAPDDPETSERLRRIHGEPAVLEADYCEGHELPPSGYTCLGLAEAFYFFYEGTAVVDALELFVEADDAQGRSSVVTIKLPYVPYTCRNEYLFPIAGACVVGSIPFGHSHRFANGQEFAIDILDIRRLDDGSFSTSRGASPMVIMGSDKAADYWIFGRPVRAIADGVVLEVDNRYPDEFASNPREDFNARNEQLKQHLIEQGADPGSIPGGNYVFIDHGNGEYARYCHLRENIPVKAGDQVKRGDVIGYVGNSGQSMEPHLHLELLDSPDIPTANGLPFAFGNLDLSRALDSPSFGARNSFVFSEFIFVISD